MERRKQRKERTIYSDFFTEERFIRAREKLFETSAGDQGHMWNTPEDVPGMDVFEELSSIDSERWDAEKGNLEKTFGKESLFLAKGTVRRWDGPYDGGRLFWGFDGLVDLTSSCENVRYYDVDGHFFVFGACHDGTLNFEVKKVTAAGERFIQNNGYAFDRRSLNEKLSANPKYTHLIHYMHGTHGSLRRESVVA